MLMESETTKLKERDERHQTQLEAWKAELVPRKKVRHAHMVGLELKLFRVSEICKTKVRKIPIIRNAYETGKYQD